MRHIFQTAVLGFAFGISCACVAQTPSSPAAHPTTKRSQGFLDYALGKINPNNKDYGTSAADARGEVVAYTIQNLYFWSNAVCLMLLTATSTALVLVLRTQDKREIIAAALIAQLWNGRVVDRKEIVRRTAMYNALVEAKNSTLTLKPTATADEEPAAATTNSRFQQKPSGKTGVQGKASPSSSPSSTGEIDGTGSSDPGQDRLLKEKQFKALRDSERNLRTRLNQVSQDLERERQRNQTLKGA